MLLHPPSRRHPGGQRPTFAVGPWHVLAHVASCQRTRGARVICGMGYTFGDNIEHLWAFLRRWAGLLRYMSSAARNDHINSLVRGPTKLSPVLHTRSSGMCAHAWGARIYGVHALRHMHVRAFLHRWAGLLRYTSTMTTSSACMGSHKPASSLAHTHPCP